jgi:hypothetical protein
MDAAAGVTPDEARTGDGRTLYIERQGTGPGPRWCSRRGWARPARPGERWCLADDLTDVLDHLDEVGQASGPFVLVALAAS